MEIIDLVDDIKDFPGRAPWRLRGQTDIRDLLVHHTAGPEDATPLDVHHSQRNRNFGTPERPAYTPRVTYHYLISTDGTTYKCNLATWVTWHCPGKNRTGVAICLIGNRSLRPVPPPQWDSLVALVRVVMGAYQIPIDRVAFHRTYTATQCPGVLMNLEGLCDALGAITEV